MKFSIGQQSSRGGRKYNEDRMAYCYSRDALLMVVADGLGGHGHGDVAAQIAVQFLTENFKKEATTTLKEPGRFLRESLYYAHQAICSYAEHNHLKDSPRTTCIACVVQNNEAYWAHAGDSRLYFFRNHKVIAHTKDHSRVQMLLDLKEITREQAAVHPERNRIYSCLGGSVLPEVALSQATPVKVGDVMVLCTDGFWSMVTLQEMDTAFDLYPANQAVTELTGFAEARGGATGDNITVIAMRWGGKSGAKVNPISTRGMPVDAFTTQMSTARLNNEDKSAADALFSEEEMDKAIKEIQTAIRKYQKRWQDE